MGWREKHQHIPSDNPVIPRETVDMAHRVLQAEMLGQSHPVSGAPISKEQSIAARELLKLYQTQDRFSAERVKELSQSPKASENIRKLAALDAEGLNRMTEQLLAESDSA